jgi:hypothetical protein
MRIFTIAAIAASSPQAYAVGPAAVLAAGAEAASIATAVADLLSRLDTDRAVVVAVTNRTKHTLKWAGMHANSGSISSFPHEIAAGETGLVAAMKTKGTVRGAVGIFRYSLGESKQALEVMYQVPCDYNLYSNLFNGNVVADDGAPNAKRFDINYKHAYTAGKETGDEKSEGYRLQMSMGTNSNSQLNVIISQ